ncbi:MAG: hypothetical protein RLZZ59_862 [Pseudomonadota bacterium]|jgi:hypothetical protein
MTKKVEEQVKKPSVDEQLQHLIKEGSHTLDHELVDLDDDKLDLPKLEDLLKKPQEKK